MRFFRFVANPLSPEVALGTVTIRMHFQLTGQMIYATFIDLGASVSWVKVPDADMGQWGAVVDFLKSGLGGPPPYLFFQEGIPLVPEANVPLWSSQLQPYSNAPEIMPAPWPVLQT